MEFEFQTVEPVASNWFSPTIQYEGLGRAELLSPKGYVEGPVTAQYDEHGQYSVKMQVKNWRAEDPAVTILPQLLQATGLTANPVSQLVVRDAAGQSLTLAAPYYNYTLQLFDRDNSTTLDFRSNRSVFECPNSSAPKYWVLPLSNFLSDLMPADPILGAHPLRIYPSRAVPAGLSAEATGIATYIANQRNRLIVFDFNSVNGFIEALADYEERKAQLSRGQTQNIVTAIMVGEVSGKSARDWADLESWFPVDFLNLLSVATGSEVGAPWVEIRDKASQLVRRIHVNVGSPSFVPGHRAIDEVAHRGTGLLLTSAASCQIWGTSVLRVALKQIVRGGQLRQMTLEDRFNALCRGMELLSKYFSLDTQNTLDGFDPIQTLAVKTVLAQAAQQISNLAQAGGFANDPAKARRLQTMASRVQNASGTAKDFGLAVCDLLQMFKLPDANIIDAHYRANPRPDGRHAWSEVLSYYRGSVVHEGYFDLAGNRHNLDEVMRLTSHLHDLLLRILLTMIGYSGTYSPTMAKFQEAKKLDWVDGNTPATQLGH